MSMRLAFLLFATVLTTAAVALAADPASPAAAENAQPVRMTYDEMVRPHDRYLFIGDEVTQQMFYVRGVGAALVALQPDDDLRFFNGGKDGATAATAGRFAEDLLKITRPTVAFVCLGLNDIEGPGDVDSRVDAYERDLTALVERCKESPDVRRVVVITPPPVHRHDDTRTTASAENQGLAQLARASQRVAAKTGSGFVNFFDHPRAFYLNAEQAADEAAKSGWYAEPVTMMGGRLPSEATHVVLASLVLEAIGVSPAQLESVGWSPLRPRQMRAVRQSLAVPAKPAKDDEQALAEAQKSRDLYLSFIHFDDAFFRAWRLSGKVRTAGTRQEALAAAEEEWGKVRAAAGVYKK
jgi:lysophospholipase L1-like esterase